ncbi:MAG: type II toxin-antitoxin system RelE/ParE family toxin [Candidatus Eremiobacteraeota bacterium]|nr:type II toxin-antitoxin system RelE/ParE family toxin [Candidatus Eremiobacteraeota bacterium]
MTSVRFLPEAKDEFVEAAKFYERREEGLGDRFLDELENCLERITSQPSLGNVVTRALRRRILRKFPFSVIYAHEEKSIVVVAVAHTSRKPGYWKSRKES